MIRTALGVIACTLLLWMSAHPTAAQDAAFDHQAFDDVLSTYVDAEGMVDYAGLARDRERTLQPYLDALAEADAGALSDDAALAFWINAYNALTLDLIAQHYPVDDIFATHEENPFEQPVGTVAGHTLSLDALEHDFIDARFDDPRFHFAIVCAAMSCPPLRTEAYTGNRIDEQLQDQAEAFIRRHQDNRIVGRTDEIVLSTVFDWFKDDFGETAAGVQRYLAGFFDGDTKHRLQQAAFSVSFAEYDWTLNDQAKVGRR